MSLATTREKRKNAGLKMAKLLDEEEEDEFYKTAYGGFQEVYRKKFNFLINFDLYISNLRQINKD